MPFEELCKLIAQKLLQGCMNHEQFANYYDFLGLEGYKLCHEYHYFEQMCAYRQFISYYIKHYNKLIPTSTNESLLSFTIIPNNWYDYLRDDMDINTRRNAVKSGIEKYVHWEEQVKNFLEDMYTQTMSQRHVAMSFKIKQLIQSVEKEIEKAKQTYLELKAIDYDLSVIIEKQQGLAKKYRKKLEQIKPRKEFNHVKSS